MTIKTLEILNCRNLQHVSVDLDERHNLLLGVNASGKTSFLEAIHILSSAKSFRSTTLSDVICVNAHELVLSALVISGNESHTRIGLRKSGKEPVLAKRDGVTLQRVSGLAEVVPVVLVDSASFELVEAGPSVRRDYLNLGMFHVEHSFLPLWKQFSAAHKQRNAILKSLGTVRKGKDRPSVEELTLWTDTYCRYAESLHGLRMSFLDHLLPYVQRILLELGFNESHEFSFNYKPGWNTDKGLRSVLEEHTDREQIMGTTLYGPHKADIVLTNKHLFSRDFLSRGQKKLLVYAMRLALTEYISDKAGKTPLLLLDDLPSELDHESCSAICRYLKNSTKAQTIITAVSNSSSVDIITSHLQPRMFHVEHGEINLMTNEDSTGMPPVE